MGGMSRKRSKIQHQHGMPGNNVLHRRTSHGGHGGYAQHKRNDGQKGIVGSTSSRLEINFKIYDYDETDDDFFMGSYKHKIKWSMEALREHQSGGLLPKEMTRKLTNRENAGRFKFRIFTGTLQHYLSGRKWGNKDRRR